MPVSGEMDRIGGVRERAALLLPTVEMGLKTIGDEDEDRALTRGITLDKYDMMNRNRLLYVVSVMVYQPSLCRCTINDWRSEKVWGKSGG